MIKLFANKNTKDVNVKDLDQLIGSIELIDIREPYEYRSGSIKTAVNIPMGMLLEDPEQYLEKDQTYYIICHSGRRSRSTVELLEKQGYDVINVAGGVSSYKGAHGQRV